jgi:diguanylate cyclase (GGDEF)-like protein
MTSQTHPLTGLPARPALENDLKQALSSEESCALALLDMDYFRELNEELGSEAGDALLRDMAALLSEAQPGGAYHIGGDEFALLLRNVSLEQAFLAMEQLRARAQTAAARHRLADGRASSATLGVAQFPRDAGDARALWSKASAALQAAKENGRNTVSLPPNEEMVMKSCYYPASSTRKLAALAKRLGRKESPLLREALDDLFRKYDLPTQAG